MPFYKAILAACFFVCLGLNTAAHGLNRIAPEISGEILQISEANEIWAVEVLGRQYDFDVKRAQDIITRGKNYLQLAAENIRESVLSQVSSLLCPK
ncbi:MAG: hypothetical protein ACOYI2_01390 [Bacillota bacterium]